jgi:hypothetical protein
MDQDTPMNTGFGATTGSETGTASGFGTASGAGMNSGTTGSGANRGMDTAGSVCPTCGHAKNAGLEQFLGKLGINDDMLNNLKNQMQNVDVEEYLNTAREYLKTGSTKASSFARENPGKVAAGVAVLAIGAGLLINSMRE